MDSAQTWIRHRPELSPAFIAVRAGYDVWLGNSRGNTYSLAFESPATEETYWNFDWEEMGLYDIPATFDYITKVNGHYRIGYIGHSMGTTQMFYALAKLPSYFKDRLSVFIALSPITSVTNHKVSLLKFLMIFKDDLFLIFAVFKVVDLFPYM